MHRLPRLFVSVILRHGGAWYRNSTAPISCASTHCSSVGEIDRQVRWHSVLVPGKCNTTNSATSNLKNGLYFGNRYESTAAASDASAAPPAETYKYQAEVSHLIDLIVNNLYSNKETIILRDTDVANSLVAFL
ncbi:hypothetical protein ACFX14_009280 [Malus domestica]